MKDMIGGSALCVGGIDTAPDDSVNRDRVVQLANEIGPRDFNSTAELFLMEIEVALDALVGVTAPNVLIDELHFVKGCALNLGMTGMALMCQDGVAAARMAEPVDLPQIKACYRRSRDRFLNEVCRDVAA